MKKHRASKRYATALFELSKEENVISTVSENLKMIDNTLSESKELELLLDSPDVSKQDKKSILEELFADKVHVIVNNLFKLLLEKNREMLIPEIIEWFFEMEDDYNNIVRAELISAVPLDEGQKEQLARIIEAKVSKKVVFKEKVDNSIIGGFIIKTSDKIIDASIANELQKMRTRLISAEIN